MARPVSEMHTSTICCHQLRSRRSEGEDESGLGGGGRVIIGAKESLKTEEDAKKEEERVE